MPVIIKRGRAGLDGTTSASTRTPPGHPEGYIEAFANLYAGFADVIRARAQRRVPAAIGASVPTIDDGLKGVALSMPRSTAITTLIPDGSGRNSRDVKPHTDQAK